MCFGGNSVDPNENVHVAPYSTGDAWTQVGSSSSKETAATSTQQAPTGATAPPKIDLQNPGLTTKGLM